MGNKYSQRKPFQNIEKTFQKNVTKVPVRVLNAWTKKKSRGDVEKLIAFTGVSKPTIIRALRHGVAQPDLVLKISKYFSKIPNNRLEQLEKTALKILNTKT